MLLLKPVFRILESECTSCKIQRDHDKKSKFASVLDAIERVTGFDLDGDGTVAGDILCEVRWILK
jgi:hypothetical protein